MNASGLLSVHSTLVVDSVVDAVVLSFPKSSPSTGILSFLTAYTQAKRTRISAIAIPSTPSILMPSTPFFFPAFFADFLVCFFYIANASA